LGFLGTSKYTVGLTMYLGICSMLCCKGGSTLGDTLQRLLKTNGLRVSERDGINDPEADLGSRNPAVGARTVSNQNQSAKCTFQNEKS